MTEEELNKARGAISLAIKQRREELNMSQHELAEKTGMGLFTIQRFEGGRFWLNLKQYIIIRNALGMKPIQ